MAPQLLAPGPAAAVRVVLSQPLAGWLAEVQPTQLVMPCSLPVPPNAAFSGGSAPHGRPAACYRFLVLLLGTSCPWAACWLVACVELSLRRFQPERILRLAPAIAHGWNVLRPSLAQHGGAFLCQTHVPGLQATHTWNVLPRLAQHSLLPPSGGSPL